MQRDLRRNHAALGGKRAQCQLAPKVQLARFTLRGGDTGRNGQREWPFSIQCKAFGLYFQGRHRKRNRLQCGFIQVFEGTGVKRHISHCHAPGFCLGCRGCLGSRGHWCGFARRCSLGLNPGLKHPALVLLTHNFHLRIGQNEFPHRDGLQHQVKLHVGDLNLFDGRQSCTRLGYLAHSGRFYSQS